MKIDKGNYEAVMGIGTQKGLGYIVASRVLIIFLSSRRRPVPSFRFRGRPGMEAVLETQGGRGGR